MTPLRKVLFIPDTHVPYQDKRAFDLMCKVAKTLKIDTAVILGDFMDCYSVSSHRKSPGRQLNLEDEILATHEVLDQLDALGFKEKHYIEGNHEWRLERYLADRAPDLFGLVSIPKLLNLEERGWKWQPYNQLLRLGKLYLTHDTGRSGVKAHDAARLDLGGKNVVIGHTHRMAYSVVRDLRGHTHVSAMFGWLGDSKRVDYMHSAKAKREWPLGFGLGYWEPKTGVVHIQPVPIVFNRVCVEGKIISV